MTNSERLDRARQLLWMSFDVDGVLTDGSLFYGESGEVMKRFNALDGHGIKELQSRGVGIMLLSGRSHPSVSSRARELGIGEVFQGVGDKLATLSGWMEGKGLTMAQIGHMGDDLPDLPVLRAVGFAASVPNAHASVLECAHWVSRSKGGEGAVRELCDLVIGAKG
jgi:3-deoxy-D-manno-octulosonate 8-phosphate phosphatase (KDO 8-P phosphatase)